jgi:hypothetical protein
VAAVLVLIVCLPLTVGLSAMWISTGGQGLTLRLLAPQAMLLAGDVLAVLALIYARRLGRHARGAPGAAASAFRAVRLMWIVAVLAYGLLVVYELATF